MSNRSDPIARVYAGALVELGREQRCLGEIYDDLRAVLALYDGDTYFRQFFTSPRIDREVKWRAVRSAVEGRVGRPVLGLLRVLISKGREGAFDNLVHQFERFKDEVEHRVHASVTVAAPLEADARAELVARLERASGRTVVLHDVVDPAVIGGASIRIGDRIIDRTVRTRLAALRRILESDHPETTKR